jgi:very-short-patch-repair endonuclease
MRREPTAAEAVLWEALRGRRLGDLKFRRQYASGHLVLDFYCAAAALVVEVDGGVHAEAAQTARDLERTQHLEAAGLRMLRVSNEEVLGDVAGVLRRIEQAARETSASDGA